MRKASSSCVPYLQELCHTQAWTISAMRVPRKIT
jgi:hypothetical protein